MITKRVEQGDKIPFLPSWVNTQFDHKDYIIKKTRLDNMMRDDYDSERLENNNTKNNLNSSNTDWMEEENTYNLDNLYIEESPESLLFFLLNYILTYQYIVILILVFLIKF